LRDILIDIEKYLECSKINKDELAKRTFNDRNNNNEKRENILKKIKKTTTNINEIKNTIMNEGELEWWYYFICYGGLSSLFQIFLSSEPSFYSSEIPNIFGRNEIMKVIKIIHFFSVKKVENNYKLLENVINYTLSLCTVVINKISENNNHTNLEKPQLTLFFLKLIQHYIYTLEYIHVDPPCVKTPIKFYLFSESLTPKLPRQTLVSTGGINVDIEMKINTPTISSVILQTSPTDEKQCEHFYEFCKSIINRFYMNNKDVTTPKIKIIINSLKRPEQKRDINTTLKNELRELLVGFLNTYPEFMDYFLLTDFLPFILILLKSDEGCEFILNIMKNEKIKNGKEKYLRIILDLFPYIFINLGSLDSPSYLISPNNYLNVIKNLSNTYSNYNLLMINFLFLLCYFSKIEDCVIPMKWISDCLSLLREDISMVQ
jgi:hypothetical protein